MQGFSASVSCSSLESLAKLDTSASSSSWEKVMLMMIWVVVEVVVIRMEVIRIEVVVLRTAVQACTWFEDRVSVEREDGKWLPLDLGEDYNDDGEDYILILIIMIMM